MTELEHFIKREDVETIARVCSIARTIKTKDEDCCEKSDCFVCDLWKNKEEILKILLSQHKEKPKLTDDEKAILRSVDNKFEFIARDKDGVLFIYMRKPYKDKTRWESGALVTTLDIFNHLFQSIKWEDEEPWSIKELLEE